MKMGFMYAVEEVVDGGYTPLEITITAMEQIEGINPNGLVAALYCAGAKHDEIRMASQEAGISEMILVSGFETAKTVCGDNLQDTQAYPVGLSFQLSREVVEEDNVYGSSDAFTN